MSAKMAANGIRTHARTNQCRTLESRSIFARTNQPLLLTYPEADLNLFLISNLILILEAVIASLMGLLA